MTRDTQLRGDQRSPEFAEALEMLEVWGAAILVAGVVDDEAMQAVLRRMMGAASKDRYRLLTLLTDNDPGPYLPGTVSPDEEGVRIVRRSLGRGAAQSGHPEEITDIPPVGTNVLGELHREMVSACDAFTESSRPDENSAGTLQPGALRVVVDTLQSLILETSIDTVVKWLRAEAVPAFRNDRFRGRSHWTYYGQSDGPTVDALMADPNLFDVLIRVRRRRQQAEYKWELPADRYPHISTSKVTAWMPVDS